MPHATHRLRRAPRPWLPWFLWAAVLAVGPALLGGPARADDGGRWLEVRGPSLTLLTDADPRRAAEVALELERFRAAFARLAPEIELDPPVPTRLYAFRDARSFAPYKHVREGGGVRILGYFTGGPDGNFLTLNADPSETRALGVAIHESVHELVRHNFPWAPLWFHEGLAEYYSTFAVGDEQVEIGRPVDRHLRWFEAGRELDLDEVVALGMDDLRHDDRGAVGNLYAGAWLLVHYLLSADPENLDHTARYLSLLAEGAESTRAFEDAFGVRVRRLAEAVERYRLRGNLPVVALPLTGLPTLGDLTVHELPRADALAHLGDLAAQVGRRERAAADYHRALEAAPGHPEALSGLAVLEDASGSYLEAELLHRDAVAAPGASARAHLRYGRHLFERLAKGDAGVGEEREKSVETALAELHRAVTLEPDNALAQAWYGRAHRFPPTDPEPGIAPLVRAYRALPARLDWVYDLIALQARAGQYEAARDWLDTVLRPRADVRLLLLAEEEVDRAELTAAARAAWEEGDAREALRLFDRAVSITTDDALRAELEAQLANLQRAVDGS